MRISDLIRRVEDKSIAAVKAAQPLVAATASVTKCHAVRRTQAVKAAYKAYRSEVKS